MFALLSTLAVALVSGALTGFLLKLKILDNYTDEELFDDTTLWEVIRFLMDDLKVLW